MEEIKGESHPSATKASDVQEKIQDTEHNTAEGLEGETEEEEAHFRARVFVLADDNDWRDVATGIFQCSQQCDLLVLRIRDEQESEKILWEESISPDHMPLTVQQDTVVSWTDKDGKDVALSFESLQGCETFFHLYASFVKESSPTSFPGSLAGDGSLPEKLELGNLGVVRQLLRPPLGIGGVVMGMQRKTVLAAHILTHDYIFQLCECFRLAEDLSQQEALTDLAKIAEGLVALGNQAILNLILSPDHFPQFLGLFEYSHTKTSNNSEMDYLRRLYGETHRGNLKALFIDMAENGDLDELEGLLDETWRLQFLKDFVFGRFVEDDDTNGFLLTLIRTNQIAIFRELDNSAHYYENFTKVLQQVDRFKEIRDVTLGFLKEYLVLARSLIPQDHFNFYQNAALLKALMSFIQAVLKAQDAETEVVLQTIDVLSTIAHHDPSVIRIHGAFLVPTMIHLFLHTMDARVRWNITSLIKTLTKSPEPMNGNAMLMLMQLHSPANSKGLDDFLNGLYPSQANLLLQPLNNGSATNLDNDLVYHSCDLLTFFIKNHKYRIKYLLLRSSVPQSLGSLVRSPLPHIQLAALQSLRAMLDTGDDFYHRFFTKHKLFLPLLEHLHSNMQTNDCITSAMLELFSGYLVLNAPTTLIQHLIDLDSKRVEDLAREYACFSTLLAKTNVNVTSSTQLSSATETQSTDVQYQRILQQEAEDEYFSRDDENDKDNNFDKDNDEPSSSSTSSSSSSSGLLIEDSPSKKLKYSSPPPTTIN